MEQMNDSNDLDTTRAVSKDPGIHVPLNSEVEKLRAKLAAMQAAHDLDMEGMETLIEAKIFREDELESELADAKRALAEIRSVATVPKDMGMDQKSDSIPDSPPRARNSRERGETVKAAANERPASSYSLDGDGDCEICGLPHPLEVCWIH